MNTRLALVLQFPFLVVLGCGDSGTSGGGGSGGAPSGGGNGGTGETVTTSVINPTSTTSVMANVKADCEAPANPPSEGRCYTPTPVEPVCPEGGGGAGTGGAGGAGGDGGAGGTGGTGGAGGATMCDGILADNDCGNCIETDCCASLSACEGIPNCIDCATGGMTGCDAPAVIAAIDAVIACQDCLCATECSAETCNPVSQEPCDTGAGVACDVNGAGDGYQCWTSVNDVDICGECDAINGPYCAPGMTCLDDQGCARFCCDDGDCSDGGHCDKARHGLDPDVGVCVKD